MATYLQLCKSLHQLLRAGNNVPGSQPTSVTGNTDPLLIDIVAFVAEAWNQIQEDHPDWVWMRKSATLTLPINTSTGYNQKLPIATITNNYPDWRNVLYQNAGQYRYGLIIDPGYSPSPPPQQPCFYVPWLEFHGFFDRLPRAPAQPVRFTEDPRTFDLYFDPPPLNAPSNPATAYQFLVDYRTVNQALVNNVDVPNMPSDFHQLIVYWAGFLWCQTRSGASVANLTNACTANMKRLLDKLRAFQLPEMVMDNRYA